MPLGSVLPEGMSQRLLCLELLKARNRNIKQAPS